MLTQIAVLPESPQAPLRILEGAAANGDHPEPGEEVVGEENGNGTNGHTRKRHWSFEEMDKVAVVVAELLRKQGLRHVPQSGDRTGRAFLLDFVREAQVVLPKDRRRMSAQLQAYSLVFFKKIEDALANKTKPVAPIAATEAPKIEPAPAPAEKPVPPEGYALMSADDPLANVPLRVLFRAAFTRMLDTLEATTAENKQLREANAFLLDEFGKLSASQEKIMGRLAGHDTALAQLPAKARQALPRVAIVACRKDEMDHIERGAEKHGLKLDFRLYEQNANAKFIDADYAIMMKWGGHDYQDQVTLAIKDPTRRVFTNGGISSVINQLCIWFKPGFKATAS